jgi:hypothetical protein
MLAGVETASAALIATLNFTTPTGFVGPTDSIPIYLTLALDPSSDALITDGSGNVISGLTIPPGFNPTNTNLNEFLQCSGTFITGCGGLGSTPYQFNFNFNPPNFIAPANFDLEAGNSFTWLFGTFTPVGMTAPGTYTLPEVGVFIQMWDGQTHLGDVQIADIFSSGGPSFTRTVTGDVVPEPGTWMLMLSGLALAVGAARRKIKA